VAWQVFGEKKVIHYNFDMPDWMVGDRLDKFGFPEDGELFQIVRCEDCVVLNDSMFWHTVPVDQGDVIVIDSWGSACPLGTKDEKPIKAVLSTLATLCDRGASIMILVNTTKNGKTFKGPEEIKGRADIMYELRNATGFRPSNKKFWLTELLEKPGSAYDEWNYKKEHTGADNLRVALAETKERYGQILPQAIEISSKQIPWTVSDITHSFSRQAVEIEAAEETYKSLTKICENHPDKPAAKGALCWACIKQRQRQN
jgi:hypothetical protein